jgi:hypothetical protein
MEQLQQQQIIDLVNWAGKKQTQYKTASSKYYNKNFTLRDDMTPEEKQKVAENIKKRQEYYKRKYEANKEEYKQRVANQRALKKSQNTTQQQIAPTGN